MTRKLILAAAILLISVAALAQTPAVPATKEDFQKAVLFGKRFFDIHDYASALEQFQRSDQIYPDLPAVMYDTALVLTRLGRYSEAQAKVDQYIAAFPNGAEIPQVNKLQLELEFQREVERRQQASHDYVELFNRGKFLLQKGDFDGALRTFQQAEQQRPTDPAIAYNEALAYERTGEFAKATERLRRYLELSPTPSDKPLVDQKIFALDSDIEDMRTKFVCGFCGYKLPLGATWCPHCWHGPYLISSGRGNSRPCVAGASATRSTSYADGRFAKNEELPCLVRGGSLADSLRYSPARQRSVQAARKAEGWTYSGDIITGRVDKQGEQVRLEQGESLQRALSLSTGDALEYSGHKGSDGNWLLDREDVIIDGQKYAKSYTYDSSGRLTQEKVAYQNTAACNHLIEITADYTYENSEVSTVKFHGGYTGFATEGSPEMAWDGTLAFAYDQQGRVEKEDFVLTSQTKTFAAKPASETRDVIEQLYPGLRIRKPIDILRMGDRCWTSGTQVLGDPVDLRAFYSVSPGIATALSPGIGKVTVTYAYPESFRFR